MAWRLQDYIFVDMMVEMEEAEKLKKTAQDKIKHIFATYWMTKAWYIWRKNRMLEGTDLKTLENKYK